MLFAFNSITPSLLNVFIFFGWAHATCSDTDRLFLTWIKENEANDLCVYEKPSAYNGTTYLSGKMDEFPASDSVVSKLLIIVHQTCNKVPSTQI